VPVLDKKIMSQPRIPDQLSVLLSNMKCYFFPFLAVVMIACDSLRIHHTNKDWAYFEDWDKNHNSSLDRVEFREGYSDSEFFSKWNAKKKPISGQDFLSNLFTSLDKNKDRMLDSTEYKSRKAIWSLPGEPNLETWDTDHDKHLAADEFNTAASKELVPTFDSTADGLITETEMATAMFEICDKDRDDQVKGTEFYLWEVHRRQ
jgi:hypothetical protein